MTVFTKRFTARVQHHLTALKEGRHGHSCGIEVSLTRPFEPGDCDRIEELVIALLDGKDLNPLFKTPSGENIVEWIFSEIHRVYTSDLVGVALQETSKNRFLSSRNRIFLS